MPEINEKEFKREPGSCVIHDDDNGWGGPDETIPTEKKLKEKKIDEPMNWPWR